jgi:hypothetical protein
MVVKSVKPKKLEIQVEISGTKFITHFLLIIIIAWVILTFLFSNFFVEPKLRKLLGLEHRERKTARIAWLISFVLLAALYLVLHRLLLFLIKMIRKNKKKKKS